MIPREERSPKACTISERGVGEPCSSDANIRCVSVDSPEWLHYALVVLATLATVIASQAIITGAYSLTQQATQLGFLPRLNVIHTAGHERGQIYIPFVNWALAIDARSW